MTKAEVEARLKEIKPRLVPPGGTLELVGLAGAAIKIKVTGLPQDVFKVQGKVVRLDEEVKQKIAKNLETEFAGAKVEFI